MCTASCFPIMMYSCVHMTYKLLIRSVRSFKWASRGTGSMRPSNGCPDSFRRWRLSSYFQQVSLWDGSGRVIPSSRTCCKEREEERKRESA